MKVGVLFMRFKFLLIGLLIMACLGTALATSTTPPSDYSRYWDFNENTGTDVDDKGTDDADITLTDDSTWVTGIEGSAFQYDGATDYGLSTAMTSIGADTTGSICTWIKVTNDPANVELPFSISDGSSNFQTYMLIAISDTQDWVYALVYIDNVEQWQMHGTANAGFTDYIGEWVHVCVVQDGVEPVLYINGVDDTTFTGTTNKSKWLYDMIDDTPTSPASHLTSGAWANNNGFLAYFDGAVDDVRIYSDALTPREVREVYDFINEVTTTIILPANDTYTSSNVNLSYWINSTNAASGEPYNCTVTIDGDVNTTYPTTNNTYTSIMMTGLSNTYHNVTVECDDGVTNSSDTEYFTVEAILELSISNPTNITYIDSDLTLTYLANTTASATNINCTVSFDADENSTYTSDDNVPYTLYFRELTPTFHNVSVNCYDGNENVTRNAYYTVADVNFTLGQNATAYEGVTNFYNVTIGINPDIVSDVNASLYWNDTQVGYSYKGKRDLLTYWFNETFMPPITETNNTSINTKWNVTKAYINGTAFTENSSTSAQTVLFAWNWSATTYNSQVIERNYNDISINVSKLGGVDDPLNSSILATFNYNGSPSTMPITMNTSTALGYSNTSRVPRIPVGYNWTFGWNVTLNYSLNHGILGYNSRIDNITHTNNTQTVHISWLGNCTIINKPHVQALNFYMYDEENEESVTENFQAERINIRLADGTNRSYSLTQMTGYTNYSICIYPYFGNYPSVDIEVKYAINSSTYDARRYYLVNSTINNITNNIGLYNLDGAPITFTLLDEDNAGIGGAYLNIKRFYSSLSGYKTIAMAKTDSEGEASTYLDIKLCTGSTEAVYAVTIIDSSGTTLKDFSAQSFTDDNCDGVGTALLRIATATPYTWYILADGISYIQGCTINGTTDFNCHDDDIAASGNVTFYAKISVGTGLPFTNFTLDCTKLGLRRNTQINKTSATASGITLYCELGNETSGNEYVIKTWGYFGDVQYPINITSLDYKTYETWQDDPDAVFAAFILISSITLVGLGHPILLIILNIASVSFAAILGLFKFNILWLINWVLSALMVILILWRKD